MAAETADGNCVMVMVMEMVMVMGYNEPYCQMFCSLNTADEKIAVHLDLDGDGFRCSSA